MLEEVVFIKAKPPDVLIFQKPRYVCVYSYMHVHICMYVCVYNVYMNAKYNR